MTRWLLLVHRIPPRPIYLRARIGQRLASVGAIAVKNSVYLLPNSAEALEDFQWLAQEIGAGGGDAHVLDADFVGPGEDDAAIARFDVERNADYEAMTGAAREAMKSARSGRVAASGEVAAELAKLKRRLDEIRRIDFFDASARAEAEAAVAAVEKVVRDNTKEATRMLKAHPELRGRIWVTRPGVKVDRMASAWFIRRFIDKKARFRFADPGSPRRNDETRFDMVGGDFTHEGNRCTLETLVRHVGLPDKGVRGIAEIVHDLDLKDGKYGRDETTGVGKLIEGLVRRTDSDPERIDRGLTLFDDLHEALGSRRR